jgi:Ca2+-binding RTX toxin-like protein
MNPRTFCRLLCGAFVVQALLVGLAAADDELDNGFFDAGVQGWSVSNGTLVFDAARDGDGFGASGSARFSQLASDPYPMPLTQCVEGIESDTTYFLSARLAFAIGEISDGQSYAVVTLYSQPGCTGVLRKMAPTLSRTTAEGRGRWLDVSNGDYKNGFSTGPGVQSALVSVFAHTAVGKALTINVDNVVLAKTGVPLCHGLAATIVGTDGPDHLIGTGGRDVIVGLDGDDVIEGRGGDDVICGGKGDDDISGGGGNDLVFGENGADVLRGGAGNDSLVGGNGDDTLLGNRGVDSLYGGPGIDCWDPGPGDDPREAGCDILFNP